jgi:Skp family chaperone for outer membrane proteins
MQSGLATRVETRTLVLFIACALIPVAAFSAFGYFTVTHNFRESAQRQLNATAKNYGLLIYERLQQVDQELTRLADRYQRGELTEEQLERASDRRAIIRAVSSSKSKGATLSAPSTFTRRLLVNKRGNHAQVLIELIARN